LKALHNNEMKQAKPAIARMARSSLLISVLDGRWRAKTVAKARVTITAPIPGYRRNRATWRREILASVLAAADGAGVSFDPKQSYEVVVLLYMTKGKRHDIHDVDNRLKDILDALQGRFGRSKSSRRLIENDRKVCRVVMGKAGDPQASRPRRRWQAHGASVSASPLAIAGH